MAMGKPPTASERAKVVAKIVEETFPKLDFSLRIEKAEYRARWKSVQAVMKAKGYTVGYACGSELDRSDIAWLAGVYDPIIERYGLLLPAEGRPVILAGSEGGHVLEEAAEQSGADIALMREFQISDEDYRHAHFQKFDEILRKAGISGAQKVAIFSSGEFLPLAHYGLLARYFGQENLAFDPELLQRIKYVKSLKELKIIQQANIVADAAFRAMLAVLRPGVMEVAVAGVGDHVMKELGAHRLGFPTIVTSGDRNYTVIGPASTKKIQEGEVVAMGLSPTWKGYHGIMRRTVRVGADFTPLQRQFVEAVEGLYHVVMQKTIEAARKNLPANAIDQAGKQYLEQVKLTTVRGNNVSPKEPYTFIHNTGCSECQEGFGAVTPYSKEPLGKRVALMIDVALMGFEQRHKAQFECLYAVVEDAFWKNGTRVGVYNTLPLNVQSLVGSDQPPREVNPYYRAL